jgi:cytosine/adenosine deaminase-related metal-dependent hydrolase
MLGLHASFTLGEETLERAAEVARDLALRVHIHLAEDLVDRVTGTASGSGVVERLARFGLWRPGSIAAHAVHLDDVERRRLGALGVVVAHCPRSNQHNGVGRCDLAALVRAGVQVALGTDGYAAGMLSEAQAAILVQRQAPRFGDGRAVEEGLLQANAELASSYLPGAGRLVPGSPADVVVTRYIPPTPLTAENVWAHLLLADIESRVRHVFVHGRLVVEDGRCRLLDEAELAARCRERAARLWERFAAASRAGGQS